MFINSEKHKIIEFYENLLKEDGFAVQHELNEYRKAGWDVLVIKESEIENREELKSKILEFNERY